MLCSESLLASDCYTIPYFTIDGAIEPEFFRLRIFAEGYPKYLQPKQTTSKVYMPIPLLPKDWATNSKIPLIITEGEKKAIRACMSGYPTIAIGGVWSWRSRVGTISAKHFEWRTDNEYGFDVSDPNVISKFITRVAEPLQDINFSGREVLIFFDSDYNLNPDIQNAAYELALYLESRGANVTMAKLPETDIKQGLDDLIVENPKLNPFEDFPREFPVPVSFRLHDAVKEEQERQAVKLWQFLQKTGKFYRLSQTEYCYLQTKTKKLFTFSLLEQAFVHSEFFSYLKHSLSYSTNYKFIHTYFKELLNDAKLEEVVPHRHVATKNGNFYFQISSGRMARVSKGGIHFVDNGTDDVLFRTIPDSAFLDESKLQAALKRGITGKWLDTLQETSIQALPDTTIEQTRNLVAVQFYMAPFMQRWNGSTQLPLELCISEKSSGKTELFKLRKYILTGSQSLDSLNRDMRSWRVELFHAKGVWIADNLNNPPRIWLEVQNELSRLITEAEPSLDSRKLFTDAEVSELPIHATFAITATHNPVTLDDLMDRSFPFFMSKIPSGEIQSDWLERQMGDRHDWVADHLSVLAAFLRRDIDVSAQSRYRLKNYEQCAKAVAHTLDITYDISPLIRVIGQEVMYNDERLRAISDYTNAKHRPEVVSVADIADWVIYEQPLRYSAKKEIGNVSNLERYTLERVQTLSDLIGYRPVRSEAGIVLLQRLDTSRGMP